MGPDTERLLATDIRLEERLGGGRVDAPDEDLRVLRGGGARSCPPGDPDDSFEYPADFLVVAAAAADALLLLPELITLAGLDFRPLSRS